MTLDTSNFPLGVKNTLNGGDVPVAWINTKYWLQGEAASLRAPTRVLSRGSPRVLARCHGAQRVYALRARGRPPRATREPADDAA